MRPALAGSRPAAALTGGADRVGVRLPGDVGGGQHLSARGQQHAIHVNGNTIGGGEDARSVRAFGTGPCSRPWRNIERRCLTKNNAVSPAALAWSLGQCLAGRRVMAPQKHGVRSSFTRLLDCPLLRRGRLSGWRSRLVSGSRKRRLGQPSSILMQPTPDRLPAPVGHHLPNRGQPTLTGGVDRVGVRLLVNAARANGGTQWRHLPDCATR
jgi:hypothetical protein